MKTVTPQLEALLNAAGGGNPLFEFDFYTFTLVDGTTILRYATAPFVIAAASSSIWNPPNIFTGAGMWFDGITWEPTAMRAEGGFGSIAHWRVGLDADSWSLTFAPPPKHVITGEPFPDRIGNIPFLQAAQAGALDNADVIVSTAYYSANTGLADVYEPTDIYDEENIYNTGAIPSGVVPPTGVSPTGTLIISRGLVGNVDVGDDSCRINVTDYRSLLGQQMPRNVYRGACRHRLFDSRCGLDSALFSRTGVVSALSSSALLVSTAAILAPGGSGTFTLGVVTMTSGDNNGLKRLCTSWDGSTRFTLLSPFPYPLAAGDTFSVAAGCNKTAATCALFANTVNYGGDPYIPLPETLM